MRDRADPLLWPRVDQSPVLSLTRSGLIVRRNKEAPPREVAVVKRREAYCCNRDYERETRREPSGSSQKEFYLG